MITLRTEKRKSIIPAGRKIKINIIAKIKRKIPEIKDLIKLYDELTFLVDELKLPAAFIIVPIFSFILSV